MSNPLKNSLFNCPIQGGLAKLEFSQGTVCLWAADLGSSGQDTFHAGTFQGFPMSHFALPALSLI